MNIKMNTFGTIAEYLYIGRAANDIDVETGEIFTKSGITRNPKGRKSQYNTNKASEGWEYAYLYKIINVLSELAEEYFHDYITKNLKYNKNGKQVVGTEVRYATPDQLNVLLLEMFDEFDIEFEMIPEPNKMGKVLKDEKEEPPKPPRLLRSIPVPEKRKLYDYQQHTLDLIKQNETFDGQELKGRGQILLPTGSGKSEIMLQLLNKTGRFLIIVPVIPLIQQVFEDIRFRFRSARIMVIASDFYGFDDDRYIIPNPDDLTIRMVLKEAKPIIVLTTYASCEKSTWTEIPYDIGFFDESHHLVGRKKTIKGSDKAKTLMLKDSFKINLRLFFTATPTFYQGHESNLSMEKVKQFGPVIKKMTIREGIEHGYLTNYQLISTYSDTNTTNINKTIASIKYGFANFEMKKIIVYGNKCIEMKKLSQALQKELPDVYVSYVYANTPDDERQEIFSHFKDEKYKDEKSIVCTVAVINEGKDLPMADTVCFAHPRKTPKTIVQNIGRILRRNLNPVTKENRKKAAYILIPAIEGDFEAIQAVYEALAAYDGLTFSKKDILKQSGLKKDKIIGQLMSHVSAKLDDDGNVEEVDYDKDSVRICLHEMFSTRQRSTIMTPETRAGIIMKMARQLAVDGMFKSGDVYKAAERYGWEKLGFRGKSPEATLSAFLTTQLRDKFKYIETTDERAVYRIVTDKY